MAGTLVVAIRQGLLCKAEFEDRDRVFSSWKHQGHKQFLLELS